MNTIKALSLSAALFFTAATLATSAGAFTMSIGNSSVPGVTSSDIQLVSMKKKWYYHQNRHGDRFRHRDSHHHYFHDGYWYASPFWLLAVPLMLNNQNEHRYYYGY